MLLVKYSEDCLAEWFGSYLCADEGCVAVKGFRL